MMHLRYNIACCIFVLLVSTTVEADFQDSIEHPVLHLPEKKFSSNDYLEYSDDNRDRESLISQKWDQPVFNHNEYFSRITTESVSQIPDELDKNIVWDSDWFYDTRPLKDVQISAVSIGPSGYIGLFNRGSRVWSSETFDNQNNFNKNYGPIPENTILILDKKGNRLKEFGAFMFYMPHGLTIDKYGNFWVTDVGLHQVFKFDVKDIARVQRIRSVRRIRSMPSGRRRQKYFPTRAKPLEIKPSMALGIPFEHGNDEKRFCKPTAVAVQMDGTFFVSDGYCNSRIIKFNANGERIAHWGRHWGTAEIYQQPTEYAFYIPHALALNSESNLLYVADRENGRVVAYFTTNGTFYREYKHPSITKVYGVAYARERLYLVNGADPIANVHVRGYVLDANSGNIVSQFRPGNYDMNMPHDIAVSEDGSEIYVADLPETAYRFLQNVSMQNGSSMTHNRRINSHHEAAPLMDDDVNNSAGGTTTATLVLSLVTAAVIFIALCVAIAAVVARCQKRGCLLIMRKRMRWEAERRENFKLSSLLENRRGKSFKIMEKRPNPRDFSKLNTEPETSEDEYPENNLTRII